MNKIKLAFAFIAGLMMFSCSESDEAVLYDNYDFISIKGDSVVGGDGLEMVGSMVEITSIDTLDIHYSELISQVTVGNHVFDLDLMIDGIKKGNYTMKPDSDGPLDNIGYVKYRSMMKDSSFVTHKYAITSSSIKWQDVDKRTVLFDVDCRGRKMLNDSTFSKAQLLISGKIRAIKK